MMKVTMNMVRTFAVSVILCLGCAAASAAGVGDDTPRTGVADDAPQGGVLTFAEGNTIDLGSIEGEGTYSGELTYTNTGNEPLTVVSAFAECGCTSVEYDREPLDPGKSAKVRVTFDAAKRAYGHFTKAVRLRTSSGRRALIIVKGEIKRPYSD